MGLVENKYLALFFVIISSLLLGLNIPYVAYLSFVLASLLVITSINTKEIIVLVVVMLGMIFSTLNVHIIYTVITLIVMTLLLLELSNAYFPKYILLAVCMFKIAIIAQPQALNVTVVNTVNGLMLMTSLLVAEKFQGRILVFLLFASLFCLNDIVFEPVSLGITFFFLLPMSQNKQSFIFRALLYIVCAMALQVDFYAMNIERLLSLVLAIYSVMLVDKNAQGALTSMILLLILNYNNLNPEYLVFVGFLSIALVMFVNVNKSEPACLSR